MNHAQFGIGIVHLRSGQQDLALAAFQKGLAVTDSPLELDDALDELETLRKEGVAPADVDAIQQLIKDWIGQRVSANR